MYSLIPLERERIRAIPMIPMEPAKATRRVRPFLVIRFFRDSPRAVPKDMEVLCLYFSSTSWVFSADTSAADASAAGSSAGFAAVSLPVSRCSSLMIRPSNNRMIRVEYCSARSGLWVTMMTSLSRATSCSSSMIWTEVSESNAPVGSSARRISGSLTNALAMATRCICPPDIWEGFFFS